MVNKPYSYVKPKNQTQIDLVESLKTNPVTVVRGPAGTGKTFMSMATYVEMLLSSNEFRQLVFCRPNEPTGRSLGSFPGTPDEKLELWLKPLTANLVELLPSTEITRLRTQGRLAYQPLETIRGMSFEYSLLLVDEAQNLTKHELIAIVTRLGEGSRLVILGDPDQSDRHQSGLEWLADFCKHHNLSSGNIEFGLDDIVRSDFVGQFLRALAKKE
jgi:phosphate starvation-inducible PhoH-like protein